MAARSPYGIELSSFVGGVLDLDPTFTPRSGPENPVEVVARRWLTPHGSLPGKDKDFGRDVRQYFQQRQNAITRARAKAALEREALKDERVRSCAVTVSTVGETLRIHGVITLATGKSFALTLSVGEFRTAVSIDAA